MKKILFLLIVSIIGTNGLAATINSDFIIRNSYSGSTNHGECGIVFDVKTDGYIEPDIREIEFYVTLKDASGKSVDHIVGSASEFQYAGGKSFFDIVFGGQEVCGAIGNTVVFNKVLVSFKDGTRAKDIVKSKQLKVDKFKPVKIVIGP